MCSWEKSTKISKQISNSREKVASKCKNLHYLTIKRFGWPKKDGNLQMCKFMQLQSKSVDTTLSTGLSWGGANVIEIAILILHLPLLLDLDSHMFPQCLFLSLYYYFVVAVVVAIFQCTAKLTFTCSICFLFVIALKTIRH